MVALTIDPSQLRKLERTLGHIKGAVPKALPAAINRTLENGRTAVRREIRKRYVIKQKDIPTVISHASSAKPSGNVRLDQGMIPLYKFEVKPRGVQKRKKKSLISAQVRVGSGGKLLKHGFIGEMAGGHTGVFVRKGKERLPLKELKAIGAPIMATQPGVGPVVQKTMGDALAKNIDSQIRRFMAT